MKLENVVIGGIIVSLLLVGLVAAQEIALSTGPGHTANGVHDMNGKCPGMSHDTCPAGMSHDSCPAGMVHSSPKEAST